MKSIFLYEERGTLRHLQKERTPPFKKCLLKMKKKKGGVSIVFVGRKGRSLLRAINYSGLILLFLNCKIIRASPDSHNDLFRWQRRAEIPFDCKSEFSTNLSILIILAF